MHRLIGLLGLLLFIGLALLMSRDRKAIHWRTVAWALGLQWVFAVVVLKGGLIAAALQGVLPWPGLWVLPGGSLEWGAAARAGVPAGAAFYGLGFVVLLLLVLPSLLRRFGGIDNPLPGRILLGLAGFGMLWGNLVGKTFDRMRLVVEHLMNFAYAGASFVFGRLADGNNGLGASVQQGGQTVGHLGMVFAFVVLPTIIFVASIFAILYYLGLMQKVVGATARAMGRVLKVSGAESVSVAASILMGQTEAPLTVRPFLSRFTRSELMTIMTAGMAHVSGSIMVAYVQIARVDIVHLLTAVIMTAPGAIMMAKILEPEREAPETAGEVKVDLPNTDANLLDAAARGASEGGHLAFNVAVMLVAFIALVALVNGLMKSVHPAFTMEAVLGLVFRPFAFLMGVPWQESGTIGALLGQRMVVNEFVAFIELGKIPLAGTPEAVQALQAGLPVISAKAKLVSTFALCGFANFSSIAIQVGGIGALAPDRRGDLARLGLRAMLAGTLANFLSACIAGVLS